MLSYLLRLTAWARTWLGYVFSFTLARSSSLELGLLVSLSVELNDAVRKS